MSPAEAGGAPNQGSDTVVQPAVDKAVTAQALREIVRMVDEAEVTATASERGFLMGAIACLAVQ